jgi:hypothetical protein
MTSKQKWLEILVMVLVFGMLAAGCGDGGNRLEGTWVRDDGSIITFSRDTVTFHDDIGTFTASDNNITMLIFGESLTGSYSIDGDILTITMEGYREVFTRRR